MSNSFSLSHFRSYFPSDLSCLDEIKKQRFPNGIRCFQCRRTTIYYKLSNRTAYSCKFCRYQVYPLVGTVFEKTTTPLRLWFYAMFLMTHTRGVISAKQLQRELGVTYKTAWRIRASLYSLMTQNKADLLSEVIELDEDETKNVHKWVFFNKIEITFVQKKDSTE